jgi:hypothetical protein
MAYYPFGSKLEGLILCSKNNLLVFYGKCNEKTAALAGNGLWQEVTKSIDQLKNTVCQ